MNGCPRYCKVLPGLSYPANLAWDKQPHVSKSQNEGLTIYLEMFVPVQTAQKISF